MKLKLTDKAVEHAKAPATGRIYVFDLLLPGFALRITAKGVKSWVAFYRIAGRQRMATLERYPAKSLADARTAARAVLGDADKGIDTAAEKKAAKAPENSVGAHLDVFLERHVAKRAPRTQAEMQRYAARLRATMGTRPVGDIRRRDVVAFVDEFGLTVTANRALAFASTFFRWLVKRAVLETSPAFALERPADEVARDRVLTPDEIRAVWIACDAMPDPFGDLVRVALLTGQRKSNVRFMRWADVDEAEKVWRIPGQRPRKGERMKSGRSHEVPLSDTVLAIVQARKLDPRAPRIGDHGLVFRTPDGSPFGSYDAGKKRLDLVSGVTDWILHDLRRTCTSGMTSLGISRTVAGKVTDHAESGVTKIYDRYAYTAEKRAALDAWAQRVADILATAPGKVVELRRTA